MAYVVTLKYSPKVDIVNAELEKEDGKFIFFSSA